MTPHRKGREWAVEIVAEGSVDPPGGGRVIAYAQRSGDAWRITHRDGREVRVPTTVEALERLLMIGERDGPVDTVLLVGRRPPVDRDPEPGMTPDRQTA